MADYGAARVFVKLLGQTEVATLRDATLAKRDADKKLTNLSKASKR